MNTENKTSLEWWESVKNDNEKLVDWLKDQYHGEVTAAERIENILTTYDLSEREHSIVQRIARDERTHAEWVKGLLESRGITAEKLEKESRYWNKVLPESEVSFVELSAIAHHAETMRLERIRVISKDFTHLDINEIFCAILADEVFHAKAFEVMSTPEAIKGASQNHKDGLNALGLVI